LLKLQKPTLRDIEVVGQANPSEANNSIPTISVEDVVAELDKLNQAQPKGLTAVELQRAFNRSDKWIYKRVIEPLMRHGKMKCSLRRSTDSAGRVCHKPVYFMVGAANETESISPAKKEKASKISKNKARQKNVAYSNRAARKK
jgi:hypothetical protein